MHDDVFSRFVLDVKHGEKTGAELVSLGTALEEDMSAKRGEVKPLTGGVVNKLALV